MLNSGGITIGPVRIQRPWAQTPQSRPGRKEFVPSHRAGHSGFVRFVYKESRFWCSKPGMGQLYLSCTICADSGRLGLPSLESFNLITVKGSTYFGILNFEGRE